MLIKSLQAFFDYCLCVSDTEFNCRSHQQIASILADEEHKTCSQACYVGLAKTCVVEDSASIDVHGNQTNVSSGNSKQIHSLETFFYFQQCWLAESQPCQPMTGEQMWTHALTV
jgi:hypothetical protein